MPIMKKIYIIPQTAILEILSTNILAGTTLNTISSKRPEGETQNGTTSTSDNQFSKQNFSLWNDED